MSLSHIRRAVVIGAIVTAFTALTSSAASAGIYTWEYYDTYPTVSACEQAGSTLIGGDVVDYRCSGSSGTDLYLAYIW